MTKYKRQSTTHKLAQTLTIQQLGGDATMCNEQN